MGVYHHMDVRIPIAAILDGFIRWVSLLHRERWKLAPCHWVWWEQLLLSVTLLKPGCRCQCALDEAGISLKQCNKVCDITADFQTRWWKGHYACAKMMDLELQMPPRSPWPCSKMSKNLARGRFHNWTRTKFWNGFLHQRWHFEFGTMVWY